MDRELAEFLDQRFGVVYGRFDDVYRRFDETYGRLDGVGKQHAKLLHVLDLRFEKIDLQFQKVGVGLGGLDQRLAKVEQRLGKVEQWLDRVEELRCQSQTLAEGLQHYRQDHVEFRKEVRRDLKELHALLKHSCNHLDERLVKLEQRSGILEASQN